LRPRPFEQTRLGSRRSSGDGIVLSGDGPGHETTTTHTNPEPRAVADPDADPEPRAVADTDRDTGTESSTDLAALT
jgi:hypothetical protein